MVHDCVVCCMDFRIQETVDKLLESLNVEGGNYDQVAVAGGAGNLGQLVKHLDLSNRLHHSKRFILTVHEDCGAGATKEDLIDAARKITNLYPEHQVQAYYLYLDGSWESVN